MRRRAAPLVAPLAPARKEGHVVLAATVPAVCQRRYAAAFLFLLPDKRCWNGMCPVDLFFIKKAPCAASSMNGGRAETESNRHRHGDRPRAPVE